MFPLLTKCIKKQLTEVGLSYNSVFARKVGPTFLLLIQKITIRGITSSTNRFHCKPLFVNQGIQKDCYPVLKNKLLNHLDEDTMLLPLKIFKTGLEGKLKARPLYTLLGNFSLKTMPSGSFKIHRHMV